MNKNKIISSLLIVALFWYVIIGTLTQKSGLFPDIHAMGFSFIKTLEYVVLGVLIGIPLTFAISYWRIVEKRKSISKGVYVNDVNLSIGEVYVSHKQFIDSNVKQTVFDEDEQLKTWFATYAQNNPACRKAMLSVAQLLRSYPHIPAAVNFIGHGGANLEQHSVNVLKAAIMHTRQWTYKGIARPKDGAIARAPTGFEFEDDHICSACHESRKSRRLSKKKIPPCHQCDVNYVFDAAKDPLAVLAAFAHDIGKIHCYSIDKVTGATIDTGEPHDEFGARIMATLPGFYDLSFDEREVLNTSLAIYHHPLSFKTGINIDQALASKKSHTNEHPGGDRAAALTTFIYSSDVTAGMLEGDSLDVILNEYTENNNDDMKMDNPSKVNEDRSMPWFYFGAVRSYVIPTFQEMVFSQFEAVLKKMWREEMHKNTGFIKDGYLFLNVKMVEDTFASVAPKDLAGAFYDAPNMRKAGVSFLIRALGCALYNKKVLKLTRTQGSEDIVTPIRPLFYTTYQLNPKTPERNKIKNNIAYTKMPFIAFKYAELFPWIDTIPAPAAQKDPDVSVDFVYIPLKHFKASQLDPSLDRLPMPTDPIDGEKTEDDDEVTDAPTDETQLTETMEVAPQPASAQPPNDDTPHDRKAGGKPEHDVANDKATNTPASHGEQVSMTSLPPVGEVSPAQINDIDPAPQVAEEKPSPEKTTKQITDKGPVHAAPLAPPPSTVNKPDIKKQPLTIGVLFDFLYGMDNAKQQRFIGQIKPTAPGGKYAAILPDEEISIQIAALVQNTTRSQPALLEVRNQKSTYFSGDIKPLDVLEYVISKCDTPSEVNQVVDGQTYRFKNVLMVKFLALTAATKHADTLKPSRSGNVLFYVPKTQGDTIAAELCIKRRISELSALSVTELVVEPVIESEPVVEPVVEIVVETAPATDPAQSLDAQPELMDATIKLKSTDLFALRRAQTAHDILPYLTQESLYAANIGIVDIGENESSSIDDVLGQSVDTASLSKNLDALKAQIISLSKIPAQGFAPVFFKNDLDQTCLRFPTHP